MRFTAPPRLPPTPAKLWKFDLMTTGTDNDDDVSSTTWWSREFTPHNKYPSFVLNFLKINKYNKKSRVVTYILVVNFIIYY